MKKFYYIGVREKSGYVFITSVNRADKTFYYDKSKTPMAFTSAAAAEDMLSALRCNGFDCIMVTEFAPVEERYVKPHFLAGPVSENDQPEFVGQMIDVFEDFLDDKGVEIPNDEREDYYGDGCDDDECDDDECPLAHIFGSDYDAIADGLKTVCKRWGVI